jgi:hypothetical protein
MVALVDYPKLSCLQREFIRKHSGPPRSSGRYAFILGFIAAEVGTAACLAWAAMNPGLMEPWQGNAMGFLARVFAWWHGLGFLVVFLDFVVTGSAFDRWAAADHNSPAEAGSLFSALSRQFRCYKAGRHRRAIYHASNLAVVLMVAALAMAGWWWSAAILILSRPIAIAYSNTTKDATAKCVASLSPSMIAAIDDWNAAQTTEAITA